MVSLEKCENYSYSNVKGAVNISGLKETIIPTIAVELPKVRVGTVEK